MNREAPFLAKALRIVSISLSIAVLALMAASAYSGYQEVQALSAILPSHSTSNNASASSLNMSVNNSQLVISGTIPNKMVFPVKLEILGNISLGSVALGNFDSGSINIPPDHTAPLAVSLNLSAAMAKIAASPALIQRVLFNSSVMQLNAGISASVLPLIGINITSGLNSTVGPIMGNLSATLDTSQAQLSPNGNFLSVPLTISWEDYAPFVLSGFRFNATILSIPGGQVGNYGGASGPLAFTPGKNSATYTLQLPLSDFRNGGTLAHGSYTLLLVITGPQIQESMQKVVSV